VTSADGRGDGDPGTDGYPRRRPPRPGGATGSTRSVGSASGRTASATRATGARAGTAGSSRAGTAGSSRAGTATAPGRRPARPDGAEPVRRGATARDRPTRRPPASRQAPRQAPRRPPGESVRPVRGPIRLANPRGRLRAAAIFLVLVMLVLAGRLTQLQGLQAHVYADRAEAQRLRVVNLPAVRGTIEDRSGATLAQDVDARSVYANPTLVTDADALARTLAPVIRQPASALVPKLRQHGEFVYLAHGLTPAVGAKVSALGLSGIGVVETRRRFYPSGTLAADVLGFTTRGTNDTMVGMGGVERAYDSTLRGEAGLLRIEQDPAGRPIPSAETHELEPEPGSAVRLTLDRDIQWSAQQAITQAVASTGADGGTAIVMDPHTGEVIAMAEAPAFDPNNLAQASPSSLSNRAVSNVYEPGSTNKVITVAAAVDAGLVTPNTPVTVPSHLVIDKQSFSDAEPHGTEHLTVTGVLAKSSNIGAIEISHALGTARLERALRSFGLGSTTGIGLPGESAGLLPPSSRWDPQQAATISFGQGMSATAIQMASVYATIANGGVRVKPKIVESTVGADGTVHPTPTDPGTRVVSPATARTVSAMLESVATNVGTAPAAAIPGYRVAGKTGTASRYDSTLHKYSGYVSSFIGFAPANNPRLVVDVVLDNPRQEYYGGAVAAPVFNKIMTFALASLGIPPTTTEPPKLTIDLDDHS